MLLRAPNRPAMIWLEASWRHHGKMHDHAPYHVGAELLHAPVLQYYDVPQLAMIKALGSQAAGVNRQWIRTHFLSDNCCHIGRLGHKMNAQILAHFIDMMKTHNNIDPRAVSFGAEWNGMEPTGSGRDWLPQTGWVDPIVARKYDADSATLVDFSKNGSETIVRANLHFAFGEDVRGKPGLYSTTVGAMVLLKIDRQYKAGRSLLVLVGLLKSYAHMLLFQGYAPMLLCTWGPMLLCLPKLLCSCFKDMLLCTQGAHDLEDFPSEFSVRNCLKVLS